MNDKSLQILSSPYTFTEKYLWSKESCTCVNRSFHMVRILKKERSLSMLYYLSCFFGFCSCCCCFSNSSFFLTLFRDKGGMQQVHYKEETGFGVLPKSDISSKTCMIKYLEKIYHTKTFHVLVMYIICCFSHFHCFISRKWQKSVKLLLFPPRE